MGAEVTAALVVSQLHIIFEHVETCRADNGRTECIALTPLPSPVLPFSLSLSFVATGREERAPESCPELVAFGSPPHVGLDCFAATSSLRPSNISRFVDVLVPDSARVAVAGHGQH